MPRGLVCVVGKECTQRVEIAVSDRVHGRGKPAIFKEPVQKEHIAEGDDERRSREVFGLPSVFGLMVFRGNLAECVRGDVIDEKTALILFYYRIHAPLFAK